MATYYAPALQRQVCGKDQDPASKDGCTCNRPREKVIMCTKCGYTVNNVRLRKFCPKHPLVIFYCDLTSCVTCQAPVNELLSLPDEEDAL